MWAVILVAPMSMEVEVTGKEDPAVARHDRLPSLLLPPSLLTINA